MNPWSLIPCGFVLVAGALACSGGEPSESATSTAAALSLQLDPCFAHAADQTLAPGPQQSYVASGYEDTACGWYTVDVASVSSVVASATVPGIKIDMKVVNYLPPSFEGNCSDLPPPCHPIISPASETVLGSASDRTVPDADAQLTSLSLNSPAASAGLGGDTRLLARAYQIQPDGTVILTDFSLVIVPEN